MMDRNTLLELIPAYAVDAMDADERQAVEAFIQSDPEAQAILADYQAITEMMSLAAPVRQAPTHLQSDLKSRLAARKTNHQPSTKSSSAAQSGSTPLSAAQSDSTPPASKTIESPSLKVLPKEEKPSRLIPMAAWMVAAAAVVAVAIVGGFLLFRPAPFEMSEIMREAKASYDTIVADASFVRYEVTAAENTSVEGELVVSADGSDAVLRIASLPQIESEQSYQLWVVTGDAPDSFGVYHWPTGHGPYYLKIDVPVEELQRLGMTIEPYDGSPHEHQPTGPSIFGIQVASAE
jgi:anti-sigma-K factor RskA